MSTHKLLLDRIEYLKVSIDVNEGEFKLNDIFPQIDVNYDHVKILHRTQLNFDEKNPDDPRQFYLILGTKVGTIDDSRPAPYNIEVLLAGYFRYVGAEFSGVDRFRAVRFSGYQILYGAAREIVAQITGRGPHGLFHLPAKNFGLMAKIHAEKDEKKRQQLLLKSGSQDQDQENRSCSKNSNEKSGQLVNRANATKRTSRSKSKDID